MRLRIILLSALAAGAAVADNALILKPHAGGWRVGGFRDVAVLAVTEGRPLGAASFEVLVSNTQAVRCVAAFGGGVMAGGGLQPVHDATGAARGITRVATINSWRPDAPFGTTVVATLRFDVTGEPGDTCAITLTNATLWSTAALPTNDTVAAASCRELPLGSPPASLPVTVAGEAGHGLALAGLPPQWKGGRLYPLRLTADSLGEFVSGFDVTLSFPTGAVEVLDVSTLDRQQPVIWSREEGRLRLLGTKTATVASWTETSDLATVWVAVGGMPSAGGEPMVLADGRLFNAAGLDAHGLPVPGSAYPVARVDVSPPSMLAAPPSTNICINSELVVPLSIEVSAWTPWFVGGRLTFDPARLVIVDVQPTGLLTQAAFLVDTNAFTSGQVPFVWSDFARGEFATNGVVHLADIRWRVTGGTMDRGELGCDLQIADGVRDGFNTLASSTNLPFLIRFSPDDMDGDRIPDWWAIRYYGGETNVVADGDTDHDVMTAWHEYVSRTDPTNPASCLRVESIASDPASGFVVNWSSVTGVVYTLHRATNLVSGFDGLVAEGIEALADTTQYADTNAPSVFPVYYRVTVPVP
jgi:hypothetical protein